MSRWTEEDVKKLTELYQSQSVQETAETLGRSYGAVTKKANHLGLQRHPDYALKDVFDAEVVERVKKIWKNMGSVSSVKPGENNTLKNEIKYVRINAGRRSYKDIEWLLDNVGGRVDDIQIEGSNRSWKTWGIYRQEDVRRFLEMVDAPD